MTDPTKLASIREQLLAERQRLQADVSHMVNAALHPSEELSKMPIHPADLGTDSFSQELTLSLMPSEQGQLVAIDRALARIEEGTYGICEACEGPIAPARLEGLPSATLCIACAERQERAQNRRRG